MTTVTERELPVLLTGPPVSSFRRWLAPVTFLLFGLVDILLLGGYSHHGNATFAFSAAGAAVSVPNLTLPARIACDVCGGLTLVLAAVRAFVPMGVALRRVAMGLVAFLFLIALMCWTDAGQATAFYFTDLLQSTLITSVPIMLGALTGVVCSRSGIVNIGIEGQLLLGAFMAAIVTSATGSLWLGLLCGALAGCLVAALLAVFSIAYGVDQVVLGVVLNTLIIGLTDYLFDAVLSPYSQTLNSPSTFSAFKIPLLGDIPIIGPVFFDSTIFLYITYVLLILVQVGLFSTRWGLRVRAVGEHPLAADTVGIRVLGTRYGAVIMGGLIAGIGGAYLTIGSAGNFSPNISSGMGYIALAALIFGRWTPMGALAAALLFGFTSELQSVLSTINVPIPSDILLMAPYVATIIAVAGLVGRVRAPAADGKPYITS
jgi:general nucleoside transport system permease protein